jgi:hypothetical protein
MSGGSYSYLFVKDAGSSNGPDRSMSIWDAEGEVERMAARLAALDYAEDAARETEELLLIMRQARVRVQARLHRLSGVWHAVEWCDSGDSGEDGIKASLEKYRNDVT